MGFIAKNWGLILVALTSGGLLLWPRLRAGSGGGAAGLSVTDAVFKINRERAVLIDVREAEEFAQEHVAQAKNVPVAQLEEKLPAVVKNKNLPVLLICRSGRSAAAALATVQKMGYTQVFSVSGGMQGWKNANMPITSGEAPSSGSGAKK